MFCYKETHNRHRHSVTACLDASSFFTEAEVAAIRAVVSALRTVVVVTIDRGAKQRIVGAGTATATERTVVVLYVTA